MIEKFTGDWLSLREAVDAAARNRDVVQQLVAWREHHSQLTIMDLGAGSGANFRFLAPRLGGEQRWLLLDNDSQLLDSIDAMMHRWASVNGFYIEPQTSGLRITGHQFSCLLESRQFDLRYIEDLASTQLVTASALLDLVSGVWLENLAQRCRSAGTAIYFALTYDGLVDWQPRDKADAAVHEWVNCHQRTDKGFGPALGPQAAEFAMHCLQRQGYHVVPGRSIWQLGTDEAKLQLALAAGYAEAVMQQKEAAATWVNDWLLRRRRLITDSLSNVTVGHTDIFAYY
jgi:hypothetical protein